MGKEYGFKPLNKRETRLLGKWLGIQELLRQGLAITLEPAGGLRIDPFRILANGVLIIVRSAFLKCYSHESQRRETNRVIESHRRLWDFKFHSSRDSIIEGAVYLFVAIGSNGLAHRFFVVPTAATVERKGWKLYPGCNNPKYGPYENAWHHITGHPPA